MGTKKRKQKSTSSRNSRRLEKQKRRDKRKANGKTKKNVTVVQRMKAADEKYGTIRLPPQQYYGLLLANGQITQAEYDEQMRVHGVDTSHLDNFSNDNPLGLEDPE